MARVLDLSRASRSQIRDWLNHLGAAAFLQKKFNLPGLPHLDAVGSDTFVWRSSSHGTITVKVR